jgi:ACS family tartrate transporter-like MFS transporter
MTEDRVFAKCAWRLLPVILVAYVVNFLDRTNIGFAALTMNPDLGFSPSVYGFGAGAFFISYSLFQVPANLILHRVGARRWIFCILMAWGAAATACALIRGPYSFYVLRFLLGVAEAGFFPGIILYLTFWFPKAWLGRTTAVFMAASTFGLFIGGPLATLIAHLNGVAGIRTWQWLFLLEGLPALLVAFAILKVIPDRPASASWLSDDEKQWVAERLQTEVGRKFNRALAALFDPRVLALGIAYAGLIFTINGFIYWLPLIVQGIGFSSGATGLVTALIWGGSIPAMVLWGRSSDRRGERTWHVASAALLAAAALTIASVTQNNFVLLLALAAGAISVESVLSPFYMLAPLFLTGPAMAGGFALVSAMGSLIGGFAGQYLIGIIRERSGGYALVLAAMAGAMLITTMIVLALDRTIFSREATKPVAAA